MDRLIESRQEWLLGVGSERWTATEEEEKNQLFFFICLSLLFSSLLCCSIDRLIDWILLLGFFVVLMGV